MALIDHIIYAKWIIPCDGTDSVLSNHALLIHQGYIKAILPVNEVKEHYQAKQVDHFDQHAILPGFINAHTHSAMNIFRGLADDLALSDWLQNYIWPAEGKWVSEELVYEGTLLAIAEMIRSGTTCFNDMYFFIQMTAKAAIEAGIRASIGMTIINVPTAYAKTTAEYFDKARLFYDEYHHNPFIKPTFAPHSPYAVDRASLEKVKMLADDYQIKTNIHLHEAASEIEFGIKEYGKRPLKVLDEIGLVNPNLIAIHMTQLNDEDFDILQRTKPNIVHCPESNMKLASGGCHVQSLLDRGLNVALGTDGAASNNDLDMITEMRSAAFLGKHITQNPKATSAHTVLQMATLHGARALGIDHEVGSLAPNKCADFIAINLDEIETQPLYHPISQIVYAGGRHQVTDVFVAGTALMRNRQLQTLDENYLSQIAEKWRKKINK